MNAAAWLLAIGMGVCAIGWFWAVTLGGPFRPLKNEVSEVMQGAFMATAVLIAVAMLASG